MQEQSETSNFKEEEKSFTYFPKIQKFTIDLENGDLATTALILYGFVLYGMTRIGKTATAHLLSGNPLKGFKKGGQEMVDVTTSKNSNSKIGNTMNSETLVPNKFELKNYKISDHPACVVDTPGYGDTYGILRILANGYFHYRLYSKIQNIKFIVCFDSIQLKNTGKDIIQTIVQFTKSFNNYPEMKNKIWQSCCFLFTKVDQNEDTAQTIKQKLKTLVSSLKTQHRPQTQLLIKTFIQYMIDQDKIFFIKKYKNGQSSNDAKLLQNIDNKVKTWWSRELNPQKKEEVEMSDVAFSLGKDVVVETTANEVSQEQLAELVKLYNQRIEEFVGGRKSSLGEVFSQLVTDALGSPHSHNFLKVMSKYVQKYYPITKKGQKEDGYKEEREKEELKLFLPTVALSSSKSSKEAKLFDRKLKGKNYPIKKLNALKNIHKLMNQINEKECVDRDIVWLQQCENILISIIKELAKVAYTKSDRKNIIYRYGYIVRRIVEEAKVFVLLLEKFSTKSMKQSIKQKSNGKQIDLFRPLKDFMGLGFSYKQKNELEYQQLHSMYVKNFDPQSEENKEFEITEDFVDFFNEAKVQDDETNLKIAKIVLKYSTKTLNDKTRTINHGEQCRLVEKLSKVIQSCNNIFMMTEQKKDKDRVMMLVRKLGRNLGRVLGDMKKYDLSRKVYDSVLHVNSVCKLYRSEIEQLDNDEKSSIKIRISYSKYLMSHLRKVEGIEMLQETFELAEQSEDLEMVHMQLKEGMICVKENKEQKPSEYEKDIFDNIFIRSVSEQVFKQLQSLYKIEGKEDTLNEESVPKQNLQQKQEVSSS